MSDLGLSTIAQLLFRNEHSIDFARIVSELDGALMRFQDKDVCIEWDRDDFVSFEVPGSRIVLAWSEVNRVGYSGCLSVSVGPGEKAQRGFHEDLCSRLVDRICVRFDPLSIMWLQADGVVEAELIEDLLADLPNMGTILPEIDSLMDSLSDTEARLLAEQEASEHEEWAKPAVVGGTQAANAPQMPAAARAANDNQIGWTQSNPVLDRVRRSLYMTQDQAAPHSRHKRLAVKCLDATLVVALAPVGATLMAHSMLRGRNMRLSSRVMAVIGTLLSVAHMPVASAMAALAKSSS